MDRIEPSTVTRLLHDWRAGRRDALEALFPLVYDELRQLAGRRMRGERRDHTLQTTALVHEAYVRLLGADVSWTDRAHFFAVAAQCMRRILVDHARARGRRKRGGDVEMVPLDEALASTAGPDVDVLALDEALKLLEAVDSRKARALELHYFGGLTYDEIATALDVSPVTVHRELRFAKAWMRREMSGGGR